VKASSSPVQQPEPVPVQAKFSSKCISQCHPEQQPELISHWCAESSPSSGPSASPSAGPSASPSGVLSASPSDVPSVAQ
jgi:hypothetical protein